MMMPSVDVTEEQIAEALSAAKEMARRTHELDLEGQPYVAVRMLCESRLAFERVMGEMGL